MGRKKKIKPLQAQAGAVRQIVNGVRDEARKVHRNQQVEQQEEGVGGAAHR